VDATANGCGDVKPVEVARYVHNGLIWVVEGRAISQSRIATFEGYLGNYVHTWTLAFRVT